MTGPPPTGEGASVGKVRIFAVIASSSIGGAERTLVTLLQRLDRDRFEVWVACHGQGPMLEEYRRHAVEVWPLDLVNIFDVRTVTRLASLMARVRADVVHTCLWTADVLGLLAGRLARSPAVVAKVEGAYHLPIGVGGLRRLRRQTLSALYRVPYRSCESVIAPSCYVRDDLTRRPGIRVDPSKVEVIHNGFDLQRVESLGRSVATPSGSGRQIVCVANFFAVKGQEWLLRALPRVLRRFPDTRCVFVGDGPDREAMQALAGHLGVQTQVAFTGLLANPFPLVGGSDVFVLPSVSEGFGVALLEALALGRPVVATRAGAIPEIIQDGRTGLLVPPRDPAALGDAIVRLLSDPALGRRLGAAGGVLVRAQFSAERMAERTTALYGRLAGARKLG